MKIGFFDSGLGGLIIMRSVVLHLPEYDYVYLGDTERVPYGNRSQTVVYEFLRQSVDHLFKRNCNLVIVACNTASARALRKLQRDWLPRHYPDRRVLGVIIPTAERAAEHNFKKVGILATQGTVNSKTFVRELKKLNGSIKVLQNSAPLLVPFIEHGEMRWMKSVLKEYLKPLITQKVDAIILGCTHYPLVKQTVRKVAGRKIAIISQDEIIPDKLRIYLERHPEIEVKLTRKKKREFLATDITPEQQRLAKQWFGSAASLKRVKIY